MLYKSDRTRAQSAVVYGYADVTVFCIEVISRAIVHQIRIVGDFQYFRIVSFEELFVSCLPVNAVG